MNKSTLDYWHCVFILKIFLHVRFQDRYPSLVVRNSHGAITSVSPGVVLVTHLCSFLGKILFLVLVTFLSVHRQHVNTPDPCLGNGSVRDHGPKTSGGIGSERPFPGVPRLLPGGNSAPYWCLERYSPLYSQADGTSYSRPQTFIDLDHFLPPTVVKDESKRERYRDKIKSYMDRAEQIKSHVKQIKEGKLLSDWLILDWFHIWKGSAPSS